MVNQGGDEAVFSNLLSKSTRMDSRDVVDQVTVEARVSGRLLPKRRESVTITMRKKLMFMLDGEELATVRNFHVTLPLNMPRSDG